MSDSQSRRAVVSATDIDPDRHDHGQRTFLQYRLAHETPAEMLGASLYELAPCKRTWPAHYHSGNEEALFVLEGELTLWLGPLGDRREFALAPGSYVALPTGPAHAHEVEATGEDVARFIVVSTMCEPDFTVLDGSSDVERMAHLVAGDPPGEYGGRYVSRTLDFDAEVPYWGEESDDEAGASESDEGDGDDDEDGADESDADRTSSIDDAAGVEDHAVSVDSLPWDEYDPPRDGHRFRRKQVGAAAGGVELGTSLYEVPAGNRTWLPHYHTGNEEAIYVLDGEGTVVLGANRETREVGAGDYAALPTGEAGYHDVVAGESGLRYLVFSTMREPDITVYPDDDMVGLYAGSAPGGPPDERTLSTYLDASAEVDYWD
mgnify:CR=1 FL=1